jgi:hypothetical protein
MKFIAKRLVLFVVLIIGFKSLSATIWETATKGFWQDSTVWVGSVAPETTSSDTFLINHPIVIENDLTLEPGAYMLIDSTGGICGHQIAEVLNNAVLEVFGILELDELYVNSGFVHIFKGNVKLTTYAEIRGQGGRLKVDDDAKFVVGEWFECLLPYYAFALDNTARLSDNPILEATTIYPNPFTNFFTITNPYKEWSQIKISDLFGREVYFNSMYASEEQKIDLHTWSKGVYVVTLSNNQRKESFRVVKQ